MLKTRIFLGHYQEKRFVAGVKAYRDLIVVSPTENEIVRDLEIVRNRIISALGKTQPLLWVGYTHSGMIGAPSGSCIWTELSESMPFGEYWFQIKTVHFRDNEVVIKLKMLRPMHSVEKKSTPNLQKAAVPDNEVGFSNSIGSMFTDTASQLIGNFSMNSSMMWLQSKKITSKNVGDSFKILFLVLVAVLTALVQFIRHLGEFTIRFMEVITKLVHVLMPLLLRCVDLLGKIIGGWYILIALMWRDTFGTRANGTPTTNFNYHQREPIMQRPASPQPYGSFSSNIGQQRRGSHYSNTSSRSRR